MRQLVLMMGVSLDGLVARRGLRRSLGIAARGPCAQGAQARVVGRRRPAPHGAHHLPGDGRVLAHVRRCLRSTHERHPKVVFSRTLDRAEWADSRIARGDLADEIAQLKGESGKDMIAWGGATFTQSLTRLGLVDEYRLILHPIALGDGLPLFKDLTAPLRLELVDAQTYGTGAALLIYRRTPAAASN